MTEDIVFSQDAVMKLSGRMEGNDALVVDVHEAAVDAASARMSESRDEAVRSFA